ncbi:PREDICTED: subtilisin-like protease SBT1.5 [Ipomoea nil]|uniref:subtilisin-like protease SBT1.5 n=1 Tax=Ipomoea nil TaxID=35883 RepID=UPI00090095BC|nr:PREDICTED: subtilisin-like protease SBT1.5 [Ipomoea nil]
MMVASSTCFLMILLSSLMFSTVLSQINGASSNFTRKQTFIVLVDPHSKPYPFVSHENWYSSLISISSAPIHVYNNLFHGFSARLTLENAKYVENSDGVLGVFQDSVLQLHTTRSPSFLGLHHLESLFVNSTSSDVVIGLIDTGIWPESESFSDEGFGDIPSRWKGECEEGVGFNASNCNKKLIGARYFVGGYEEGESFAGEYRSPRDSDGHGTHVASIAAGAPVPDAGFFGFAGGLARGMAPGARISIYKVCWASGCLMSDVVAAFDKAVSDGVDIISYSLGLSQLPFYLDFLAIAAFRAVQRGVLVVASAGNEGPLTGSITNAPPWILTVGAGTLDRRFPALVHLGNGQILSGESVTLSTRSILGRYPLQLHLLRNVTSSSSFDFSRQDIVGKIVLCMLHKHVPRLSLGMFLKKAGALAMLISHGEIDPEGLISEPHEIPTITIGVAEAQMAADYILANENPVAAISSGGTVSKHARSAPTVASFSSRGPNSMVPAILKPDIIAPGVNILAAWTGAVGPSGIASDDRRSSFNILSGTSMACPHVAGIGALIKSVHPNWGPSEIKSALMATASIQESFYHKSIHFSPIQDESTNNTSNPFVMGVGHIHPKRAMDPHLVFDTTHQDYIHFFCKLNYTKKQIKIITGKSNIFCSNSDNDDLNYPAIIVDEEVARGGVALVRRLKKVSEGVEEYEGKVVGPRGYYRMNVRPKRLKFHRIGERLKFTVNLKGQSRNRRDLWVGAIIWRERVQRHKGVRCPIIIYPTNA